MQIAVRVEPSTNHGFSASSPFVPEVSVETATADIAVAELREQIAGLIAKGELRTVELPDAIVFGSIHRFAPARANR